MPDARYESGSVDLAPGDLLVACTDGITEAMDADGNEYGKPRLAESVCKCREQAPKEVLRRILEEVDAHSQGGIHEDDRVLMVMKVV